MACCAKNEYEQLEKEPKTRSFLRIVVIALFLVAIIVAITLFVYFFHEPTPTQKCSGIVFPNATLADGWCGSIIFSGLTRARGTHLLPNGDILIVERDDVNLTGSIWVIFPTNNITYESYNRTLLVENAPEDCTDFGASACINHGISFYDGFIYASSDSTVFRWKYDFESREISPTYEIAVENVPPRTGIHRTRTLLFDSQGYLYVSVAALGNIDPDESHAEIRRFFFGNVSSGDLPINYPNGELWAAGFRNEVGITFDRDGNLWGVENGIDSLSRPDLGNIALDNPSEEFNLIEKGKFYGYPYCFSEYQFPANISGRGRGSQWVTEPFMGDGIHSDQWCIDNSIPPRYNLEAHSAPLDVKFYYGESWPNYFGNAFVTRHGSGQGQGGRLQGFDVVMVNFQNNTPVSSSSIIRWDKLTENTTVLEVNLNWHKFVGLVIGKCKFSSDCIYVTSDNTRGPVGGIFAVLWRE